MNRILATAILFLTPVSAFAQSIPSATEISQQSVESSVRSNASAALAALDAKDYAQATSLLRSASLNANRLSILTVTERITVNAPSFQVADSNFALGRSSTLAFDNFLRNGETYERRFKDQDGKIVTVRVFGEDDDLKDFMFIANDTAMLDKASIELAEMGGEPALKKRGTDGSLSLVMMSEDDHVLVEIEGESEATVMAFVEQIESM